MFQIEECVRIHLESRIRETFMPFIKLEGVEAPMEVNLPREIAVVEVADVAEI